MPDWDEESEARYAVEGNQPISDELVVFIALIGGGFLAVPFYDYLGPMLTFFLAIPCVFLCGYLAVKFKERQIVDQEKAIEKLRRIREQKEKNKSREAEERL